MGNAVEKITPGAVKKRKAAEKAAAVQIQTQKQIATEQKAAAEEAKVEQKKALKQTAEIQRQSSEERNEQMSEIAERQALRKRIRAGRSSLLSGSALGVEERSSTLG